jgi:hypothetical protein
MTLMCLLQGLVFGLVLNNSELAGDEQGKSLLVMTLVTVLGILLLVTAYRQWRTEDDPDATPPKWMAMIDNLTPLKALGFGFGLLLICGKCWVFMLGAIGEIAEAELGQPASQHHRLPSFRAAGRNPVVATDLDQIGLATTIQEPACFDLLLADPIQPHNRDRSLSGVRPDLPV